MKKTEFIVRGVCVKNGRVLLCQNKSKTYSYLPGGHIEYRERAEEALVREIEEELGLASTIKKFLGCAEFCFHPNHHWIAEINLVFEVAIPKVPARKNPDSAEDHLFFFWHPLKTLDDSNLEPKALRAILPQWLETPGFSSSGDGWKKY